MPTEGSEGFAHEFFVCERAVNFSGIEECYAAADGAVVMGKNNELLGFGGMISGRLPDVKSVGIFWSFSVDQVQKMIASDTPLFRGLAGPNWRFVELPTGHWPMFSRPDDLAKLLLDLPSDALVGDDATGGS